MTNESILETELLECDRIAKNTALLRMRLPLLVPVLNVPSLRYLYFYPADCKIIMGIRERQDFTGIRALHKGVWEKDAPTFDEEDAGTLRYQATVDGVLIDCRVNGLPPTCHVEEERVEVPACVKIIRRVVCNDPEKATAEKGKLISVDEQPAEVEQPCPF